MSARAWYRRRNKARPRWVPIKYGRWELRDKSWGYWSVIWWEPNNR